MKNKYLLLAVIPIALLGFSLLAPIAVSQEPGPFSVPAAAFHPRLDFYTYMNDGYRLTDGLNRQSYQEYVAPVYLPQGAIVTELIYHWRDIDDDKNGHLYLYRSSNEDGGRESMASVWTSGNPGDGESSNTTIFGARVNNAVFSYYLELVHYSGLMKLYGVTIEYTLPATSYLPFITSH